MTKYREYHLRLKNSDDKVPLMLVREAIIQLDDVEASDRSDGKVIDGLARAREIAQALRVIWPLIDVKVFSIDTLKGGARIVDS